MSVDLDLRQVSPGTQELRRVLSESPKFRQVSPGTQESRSGSPVTKEIGQVSPINPESDQENRDPRVNVYLSATIRPEDRRCNSKIGDHQEEKACLTPNSPRSLIPKTGNCPPAPKKPVIRAAPSCKRKLIFFEIDRKEEIQSFFRLVHHHHHPNPDSPTKRSRKLEN
ncbi:unnamed protein product [Cuscuta epithymum]|uniref:Uncharacterized protein n=1 Tax=Cuscuta epithymum TaxID=186058 RepID=A0AAV0F3U3_9ASTE|nr:unnamed protein product [Cuscuta epithymum]